MLRFHSRLLALLVAAALAACGGSDAPSITSVKVMGDSLADVGTFGLKATVQGTASAPSYLYPERVAQAYGIATQCNVYAATGATTFVANPTAGCTNYAIGGGRINYAQNPTSKLSIVQQLTDAASAGNYATTDLLLIDGGGNDAADLVGAYLIASTDSGAAYQALLSTLLAPDVLAGNTAEQLGGLYMTALADTLADAIQAQALDKGAQYVAVLNMPAITNTPRFRMVLAGIQAANGATAAAQAEALFKAWVEAYNARLATRFANNARVAVVDFYGAFNSQVENPGQYGLSNATTPACPPTATGADGLPTYNFATCTATALSAAPPAGTSDPNWWQRYAFSDSFHPTPYGHQLLTDAISATLAARGWL